jgi:hypothetical protein
MTGQKDRYSTTEKLWKLDDTQLTTPKHDELVLMWFDKSFSMNKFSGYLPQPPKDYIWEIASIRSECPIKSKSFIIGYWDLVFEVKTNYCDILNNTPEIPYKDFYKFCPRYFFIECKPSVQSFGQTLRQINTYTSYFKDGSVMAEDMWNRNNHNHKIVLLFTPDIRFKDAFESQRINVISP